MSNPDFETKLFHNPSAALEEWWQQKQAGLEQRYQQDQREKEFWGEFARTHKDIKVSHAKFAATQHLPELQKLVEAKTDNKTVAAEIAKWTRAEFGGRSSSHDEPEPERPRRQRGETSDDRDRKVVKGFPEHGEAYTESEPDQSWSIGDEIRRRREYRREHTGIPGRKVAD